ncbi:MAG: glycosyltransferase family 39 protein, partial [Candidatus Omnitrophica bacterium]|nr:glycosyltransferase family 39 protein [Candidatus Omnitrophota bacterium]
MRKPILKDKIFWLLLALASVYILSNIATGSITTHDEAIYACVSKEILKTNSWLVPLHWDRPWLDKPPLYMWLTAISYKMFGINEFSTRLVSSLFGIAVILLMYLFSKRLYGKHTAILSSLILLGTPHFLHFAKLGVIDVPLTFFILLMIYLFWVGKAQPRHLFFIGIVFGAAYFIKGFHAFLGPAIIVIYCLFTKSLRRLFNPQFIMGILISLTAIFIFHLVQYILIGPEFLDHYFGLHIFQRATEAIEGHSGGINFYQKAIFNKNKPWSLLAYLSGIYILWQSLRHKDKRAIMILCWMSVSYILYSAVKTKLHWYIMPIYPALALSSAVFLGRFLKGKAFNLSVAAILVIMLIQVPISWAFKLGFNPDVKRAAGYAQELKNRGLKVYLYRVDNNAEKFYL